MQTPKQSAIEGVWNILWGYLFGAIANWFVLPWFGYSVNMKQALEISVVFSIISFIRGYVVRRWFNSKGQ